MDSEPPSWGILEGGPFVVLFLLALPAVAAVPFGLAPIGLVLGDAAKAGLRRRLGRLTQPVLGAAAFVAFAFGVAWAAFSTRLWGNGIVLAGVALPFALAFSLAGAGAVRWLRWAGVIVSWVGLTIVASPLLAAIASTLAASL